MARVLTCDEVHFDPVTGECSAPYFAESFSYLSIADAQTIGLAIALLWATAWCFRRIARMLR